MTASLSAAAPSSGADRSRAELLHTAPGLELLGPYEGSGFRDPRFLVRRADGQVIHLSQLLYLVVAALEGGRTAEAAARAVSQEYGRDLDVGGLLFLVETKLEPLGVVHSGSGPAPQPRANPLLAVRLHGTLVGARGARWLGRLLAPLFAAPAVAAVLTALMIVDGWLLVYGDLSGALEQVLFTPGLILLGAAVLVASAIFHEFGHAAACTYGGGRTGPIGVGLYILWPAFYTDVTDAYRLSRRARLRTDLGGIYFTGILALAGGIAYVSSGEGLLLLVVLLLHIEAAQQMLPLVRLDGYYALGDLVGVPDLFGRVRPILRSFLRGQPADPRVAELRPRVRLIVTLWVLAVVPVLTAGIVLLLIQLPTLLRTTWQSLEIQTSLAQQAWGAIEGPSDVTPLAVTSLSILLLVLPLIGLAVLVVNLLTRVICYLNGVSRRTIMRTSTTRHREAALSSSPQPANPASRPAGSPGRPGQESPAAAAPPPGATAFDDDVMLRRRGDRPNGGWRRAVFSATAGRINPGPSRAERVASDRLERVRTPVAETRRIVVLSRKGGVGKTTTAVMLGHTLAMNRGDRVVAVDANPDAGNLAYRIPGRSTMTVTSLLNDQWRIESYTDVRRYTSQAPSRLEVLASDDDPRITQRLGDFDYRLAIKLLDRHYSLMVVDTGTGILDPATQGILEEADHLVIVMPPALDGARAAASTLDWLEQHDYDHLVQGSVAVINAVQGRGLVDLDRIEEHFIRRCASVVRIPWDRTLEAGAQTRPEQLRPETRAAYLELAAAVAQQFATTGGRERRLAKHTTKSTAEHGVAGESASPANGADASGVSRSGPGAEHSAPERVR